MSSVLTVDDDVVYVGGDEERVGLPARVIALGATATGPSDSIEIEFADPDASGRRSLTTTRGSVVPMRETILPETIERDTVKDPI